MSGVADYVRGIEVPATRIWPYLYDEFNAFQYGFDSEDEGYRQDFRSIFLQFFFTFAPELVPPELVKEVAIYLNSVTDRAKHRTFGWYNLGHLNAAMFAYTKQPGWIEELVGNLGHHSSSTRERVCSMLAPCADKMDAFDSTLLDRIQFNLSELHFSNEMQISLFVAGRGDTARKEEMLRKWISEYNPIASGIREATALSSGKYIANPLAAPLRYFERYVMLRLAAEQGEIPLQLVPRASTGYAAMGSMAKAITLSAGEILDRIESHPLSGQFVELKRHSYPGDIFRRAYQTQDSTDPDGTARSVSITEDSI